LSDHPEPTSRALRRRGWNDRSGQLAMLVGLVVFGVASYVFLTLSARALGPARFGQVSVLWAALYLLGSGLFVPLEQELGRSIAARIARGSSSGSLARRVAAIGLGAYGVVAVATLAASGPLADALFRGERSFVVVGLVGVGGVGAMFFARGLLAGSGRYHALGLLFVVDSLAKCVPTAALAIAGVTDPIAYGIVLAVSFFVAPLALYPLLRRAEIDEPGPVPEWSPLASSLGFLLLTSFLSSAVVNIGTIAVEVLAAPDEQAEAGAFLSGLVIARIPLFLFQAVQAVVLPHLSALAAAGSMAAFGRSVRQLALAMAAATLGSTAAMAVLGPPLVRVLFGSDFALLDAGDLALLTLASMLFTCALLIGQAQIALHHQRQTSPPWFAAAIAFVVVTALWGPELFARVELGMVAAGLVATLCGGWLLRSEMRQAD